MNLRGFKFRHEIKKYLPSGANTAFYLSFEYLQNNLKYDRERIFAINISNLTGTDYYQQKVFALSKKVYGSHVKIGWESPLSNRFHIDGFLGIGIRHVKVTNNLSGLFRDAEIVDDLRLFSTFIINSGNEWRPSGTAGITIIYRIIKQTNQDEQ